MKALLKGDNSLKKEIGELTGSLREKIAYAVANQHLDTVAYAIVKKFDRMEPEKAAMIWPRVLLYMDMAGVSEKIEAVGHGLPLGESAGEEADEASNIVSHPRRGSQDAVRNG